MYSMARQMKGTNIGCDGKLWQTEKMRRNWRARSEGQNALIWQRSPEAIRSMSMSRGLDAPSAPRRLLVKVRTTPH